jgi:hypothetical protein
MQLTEESGRPDSNRGSFITGQRRTASFDATSNSVELIAETINEVSSPKAEPAQEPCSTFPEPDEGEVPWTIGRQGGASS